MKNQINTLLEKEMDRTAFLQHVGIALIALTGASAVMKALTGFGTSTATRSGFGGGTYGGGRELTR